ncbi:MAG: dihydrodipicolinate synthase family protein [Clostridia bacterium]|nr:dihydrodipicolinate synthase family protein [Clostridia bacterium]
MDIITQLVTPFYLNEVDYDVLEFSVDRQARFKTDGVLVCGRWGEKSTLKDGEHKDVAKSALRASRGRIAVYASAGSNDCAKSEAMAKDLLALGVDGVALTLPYYNKGKPREIVRSAVRIKKHAGNKRVFLFYDADRCLDGESEAELKGNNVEIVRADGEWQKCHYDGDEFILNALCVNGVLFSVIANVFPSSIIRIREKWENNEIEVAVSEWFALKEKIRLISRLSVPALKYALSLWGLSHPAVRLPLIQCDDDEKETIRRLFD